MPPLKTQPDKRKHQREYMRQWRAAHRKTWDCSVCGGPTYAKGSICRRNPDCARAYYQQRRQETSK